MNLKEAYHILGVPRDAEFSLIKKKYRQLIRMAHPDSGEGQSAVLYDAHEINTAYARIKDSFADQAPVPERKEQKEPTREMWNAPLNQYAYVEREILQYAEDYDGKVIGNFCVAKGKYLWTVEEEFSLFLLSIYKSSRDLLMEVERGLAHEVSDAIYYISAMLETGLSHAKGKAGDILIPARLFSHRLYLKDESGKEVGYLSFVDDRLYYVVIPMFEQRAVKIKIRVADDKNKLHVWLKCTDETSTRAPENLNLQIEELLKSYRNFL